jgi:hypothetical protein
VTRGGAPATLGRGARGLWPRCQCSTHARTRTRTRARAIAQTHAHARTHAHAHTLKRHAPPAPLPQEKNGAVFVSQTDTEVVPHLLEYLWKKKGGKMTLGQLVRPQARVLLDVRVRVRVPVRDCVCVCACV